MIAKKATELQKKTEEDALRKVGEVLVRKAFGWGYAAGRQSREILSDEDKVYKQQKDEYVPAILRDFLHKYYSNENKDMKPVEHDNTSTDATKKLTKK